MTRRDEAEPCLPVVRDAPVITEQRGDDGTRRLGAQSKADTLRRDDRAAKCTQERPPLDRENRAAIPFAHCRALRGTHDGVPRGSEQLRGHSYSDRIFPEQLGNAFDPQAVPVGAAIPARAVQQEFEHSFRARADATKALRPSKILVRRFEHLCKFLHENEDKFRTRTFSETHPEEVPLNGVVPAPRSPFHKTALRYAEQMIDWMS